MISMAASAAVAAAKAAATVVTNPKLLKIVGGIVLGTVIIILAPIALLLGILGAGQSIDWESPEMRQQVYDNMTDEEKARFQYFADVLAAIEDEITAQGLDVEPIKAQVIFICTMRDRELDETFYADFVSCFAEVADDEAVFANITAAFGVSFTAEEKEKILLLCEKAMASARSSSAAEPST